MIKVFSPEAFNDYDDETSYGCIYRQKDKLYYLNVEDFTEAITNGYPTLLNGYYTDVPTFIAMMQRNLILADGSGTLEIFDYAQLIDSIKLWYNIPSKSAIDKTTLKGINSFLDIDTFKNYVTQNEDIFKDSILVDTRMQQLRAEHVIENQEGRTRVIDITRLRGEIKNMLLNPTEERVDEIMQDRESGIEVVDDEILLYYIFEMAEAGYANWPLNTIHPFVNASGTIVDLDKYREMVNNYTMPGFDFFGISLKYKNNWYLNYEVFENAINNLSPSKHVSMPPLTFLRQQEAKGLIKEIVKERIVYYRITNIDIFRTNYSMYRIGINVSDKATNGDMVLLPTSGELTVEINSTWELVIKHPIDPDGRYTFLQKGSVIAIPIKVAREQTYDNQLYRIYDIQTNIDSVECVAYPVAQESAFECPVDIVYLEKYTAKEVASALTGKYPEKYYIDTDINSNRASIYAENSNLQEIIAGPDEATFLNAFGGELIYDNYIYRIRQQAGRPIEDSKDYMIQYSSNMSGIQIVENTFDVVTRIYPTSEEGYNFDSVMAAYRQYSDEYGDLTNKTVHAMHFIFDDLVDYIAELDRSLSAGEVESTRYRGESSSNVEISQELMDKMYTIYAGQPEKVQVAQECIRFCNKLIQLGILKGTKDSTIIQKMDMVSYRTGSAGTTEILESNDLFGFRMDIVNSNWDNLTINNNNFDNAIPDGFLTELKLLRDKAQARDILEVEYAFKPVYTETIPRYVDADNIRNYPFVHAKSINYSDIKLIDRYTDDEKRDKKEITRTEQLVDDIMSIITKKTTELSKTYIKKAHKGDWDHKKRIKLKKKTVHYTGREAETHLHTNNYEQRTDRVSLPYGYIFNSFKDAIEYLKHEAVLTWCTDEEEASILCEAIENGFKWCKKTNIAKWMWHTRSGGKYYGTKKYKGDGADIIKNAYHYIGNKMYWFNGKGFITKKLESFNDYKWVDNPYEVQKTKKVTDSTTGEETEEVVTDDDDQPVMVTKHRYRFQNTKGTDWFTNCWIEESASKHYWVGPDGYRVDATDDNKDEKYKTDTDTWTMRPGDDGETYRITGYSYGNHEKGIYPKKGQWLYIKENKGWFYFKDDIGTIQGNYLSDASWSWKKYKKGWRYTDGNRSYITWQWMKINGKWYYFPPGGGYADTTTDDFNENSKSFNTTNKHPELDYNREGVTDVGTSETQATTETYDANRDGVQAWIQKGFIKSLKKEILKQHLALWDNLRQNLWDAAEYDIQSLRNESLSVEIDFVLLSRYSGYENLKFLENLYLGDYVHVKSSLHNFDGDLRVIKITYDCITNKPTSMTLGYPSSNTFIKHLAKQNNAGTVKFYSPVDYIEDGYGDESYIDTGALKNSSIEAR